jgi:DNA invertase Pin-like site-specific DNA recombinase
MIFGSPSVITRSSRGRRIGECHPKAKLTDDDVRLMRELRERYGMSYGKIAEKFECSLWTVREIVNYQTRGVIHKA